MPSKIAEALKSLKSEGWAGGVYNNYDTGATCMHLAVSRVYEYDDFVSMPSDLIDDLAALDLVCQEQYPELTRVCEYGPDLSNIWAVNDAMDRTFEDVERIMEKAYIKRCSEVSS